MRTFPFLFAVVFTLAACGSPQAIDEKQIEDEVLAVIKDGEKGWNNGSVEQFMAGYWQSDALRFASGGTVSFGWQPVLERYQQHYPDKATMGTLTFSELDVKVISNDAALAFGKWQLERAEDAPRGLFTLLLRRKPEGWRIIHDHTSSGENH